jgi:hypothetical protein
MSIDEAQAEVNHAWNNSYSAQGIEKAVGSMRDKHLGHRINILIARLCFRGIYFPQMNKWAWIKLIAQNRRTIGNLITDAIGATRGSRKVREGTSQAFDA